MEKFSDNDKNRAYWLILFSSIILLLIGYKLKANFFGYILIFLPFIFSLILTYFVYPKYSKSLKAVVDFIIYIPTSIAASVFLLRLALDIPVSTLSDLFNSYLIAGYAYFIAIAVATKCCISFCDTVFSYKLENSTHINSKK
ncbi:hypothetical protein WCU81_06085 [Pectobacterium atrosepticum]|uniref:hypothetical protein n=1 Tax=Pectobacterium atrosepticum TaxID=29471 RepID=UPI000503D82C|nr:hypothetical protein [Pectobacterium atrosepticum]GKV86235.1 hypothetical protein PEC301296_25470 [Pectobacterium carotovorum subsp. carotovorum]KFX12332.1 hypothetical protein JV34_17845 [Pectobacterium atrosepticum]KMK80575.1 hypothetical protein KCQ_13780 [Pectobacterium atrosepticum ICMP 1526]MCL6390711.1 hypothetical protein [Pectobacterium atrosepticum]MDK9445212.1 hypothetical protein [Pectobacterium atrosepticum]